MRRYFNYLFLFIFALFLFTPFDSHALDITFYGSNYSVVGKCSGLNWCSPDNANVENILTIRIKDPNYQIIPDSKYVVKQNFDIWNIKNDFSIRDVDIVYDGSIRPITLTYNGKNSYKFDNFANSFFINYSVSSEFTSNSLSTGFFYELYLSKATQISRFEVKQWDIVNSGNNTGDIINNSTNTIINNQNKNQQDTNDRLDKIDNTLTDNDITDAKNNATDFFKDFNENSHGLTGVVTAPLELLQSLTTAKCESLKFKLPIVHNEVILPCMKPIYKKYFGVFFDLWQMITTGLISYNVCLNFYKKVKDLQNPNNDKIEVLNL